MQSDLLLEQQAFVRKMADQMIERQTRERAEVFSKEDAIILEQECLASDEPYYESDGQFTGGYHCARYYHPSNPGRNVQFSYTPEGEIYECIEWTPYLNYPYPL